MAPRRERAVPAPPDDLETLSYGDAVEELEQILVELEDDTVDIDELSRRVKRAAALIRLCQDRIAGARLEVEQVVADLTAGDLHGAGGGADDEDGDDLEGDGDDVVDREGDDPAGG